MPLAPRRKGTSRSLSGYIGSLPALQTLAIGLAITFTLFFWVHRHEQAVEDSGFERYAVAQVLAVERGLEDAVHALELVNQSFRTFAPVSREQFHAFTQPLLARYPHVQNFSFHRLVSNPERPAFEARMRRDHPDFSITDIVDGKRVKAAVRERYRVISYLEPMAGNELVFGLDAAAFTSSQDDAIRRASDTGHASVTSLYPLPQTWFEQRGFAVLKPVYRGGTGAQDAVIGFTMVNFRARDFAETLLASSDLLNGAAHVSMYAGASPDDRNLIFRKGSPPPPNKLALLPDWLYRDRPYTLGRTFQVAGNPWHVTVSAPQMPFHRYHLGSLLVLFGGALASILATAAMQKLSMRSRRTQQLVKDRTAELKVANERLIEDIAARKQAEHSLRHTQHILTQAQNVAHLGSWELNIKTGEMQCSDEFFRICGLEPQQEKLPLERVLAMVHPDDLDTLKKAMTTTRIERKEFKIEKRIIRPDGSVRHVLSQAEAIVDESQDLQTLAGSFLDITERKQTETALRQSQEKLRELAAHLERIKEEERKRIAREIHDELGAVLTGIKVYLSLVIDRNARSGATSDDLLVDASRLADTATETIRKVISDLRPSVLDELGVWAAIEWYLHQIEKRTGLHCECSLDEVTAATQLDPECSTMLFRIVQEALTNVVRHAEASHVTFRAVREGSDLVVEVEDDGKGMDTERALGRKSWGIVGMHERARYFGGELRVACAPDGGTTVRLRLPMEDRNEC